MKKSAKIETKQMTVDKTAASKDKGPSPKKPLTAWLFFNIAYLEKCTTENPWMLKQKALKQAGPEWEAMSSTEKARYHKMEQ